MADKVLEIAAKSVWLDGSPSERAAALERIIRAELKPLLELAEDIARQLNPEGTRRIDASIRLLAAELEHWRK